MPNGLMNEPVGRQCYTARSQCYLMRGDHILALADAEASLEMDENFIKGIHAKAEALYMKGDFEFALVYYHRGAKLRAELEEFQLGISKSVEAINNAIGPTGKCKLDTRGDMALFLQGNERWSVQKKKSKGGKSKNKNKRAVKTRATPKASDKTVKVLLGEMYADKVYLQQLLEDASFVVPKGDDEDEEHASIDNDIHKLAASGHQYITERSSFWRSQRPIAARVKEKKARMASIKKSTLNNDSGQRAKEAFDALKIKLNHIESAVDHEDWGKAIRGAESLMGLINSNVSISRDQKNELLGATNAAQGHAMLETNNLDEALKCFQTDLEISEELETPEFLDRARCNLGRVYARMMEYPKAIEFWEEKGAGPDDLENAWLFHEIGRCYMEIEDYSSALDRGKQSKQFADTTRDTEWIFNAAVLIAQAQTFLKEHEAALESFRDALAAAKNRGDNAAIMSIESAIQKLTPIVNGTADEYADEGEADEGEGALNATQKYEDAAADSAEPGAADEPADAPADEPADAPADEPAAAKEAPAADAAADTAYGGDAPADAPAAAETVADAPAAETTADAPADGGDAPAEADADKADETTA